VPYSLGAALSPWCPSYFDDRELVPRYSDERYCEEAGKIAQDSSRRVRLAGFVVSSGCSHDRL